MKKMKPGSPYYLADAERTHPGLFVVDDFGNAIPISILEHRCHYPIDLDM